MKPAVGWVQWRDLPGEAPTWQFGRLEDSDTGLAFVPQEPRASTSRWILPGLVDVHNHLSIGERGGVEDDAALVSAGEEIRSGVLALREMGNPTPGRNLGGTGQNLPRLVGAGKHIARPKRYLPNLAIEVEDPADLPVVVAEQAQLGEGWVKLVGDWIDRSAGASADLEPLWQLPELKDAVAAAHENGARVAVHTFGSKAVGDLIEAGVDSIEHGTGLTYEQAQEVAARGIPVTPTLGQVELFPDFAAAAHKYPVYANTMMGLYQNRRDWWDGLLEANVHLLPGTDAGGYQPHGQMQAELLRWQDWDLDATSIVDFATWKARDFLGFDSLSAGAPADLLILKSDPTLDVSVLKHPERIVLDGDYV